MGYLNAFKSEGFENLDEVKSCTEDEIKNVMKFKLGHWSKFRKYLNVEPLNSLEKKSMIPICAAYNSPSSYCKLGDNCLNSHTNACYFYLLGTCKNGDNCTYNHILTGPKHISNNTNKIKDDTSKISSIP